MSPGYLFPAPPTGRRPDLWRAFRLVLPLLGLPLALTAQAASRLEAPSAPVAVLMTALYNDQANLREASDSAKPAVATEMLRTQLTEHLGAQALPYDLIDSLATSPAAVELAGGVACNVKVACARAVASRADAVWVVMTKVSKTSNLIWLLSAQLIRVSNGDIILDDSTELKGDPDGMIRVGIRIFADRVARAIRNGGVANNYPHGEPTW